MGYNNSLFFDQFARINAFKIKRKCPPQFFNRGADVCTPVSGYHCGYSESTAFILTGKTGLEESILMMILIF